jgi:hypothetical protein
LFSTGCVLELEWLRFVDSASPQNVGGSVMGSLGKGALLWMLGIPLPIVLLLFLFHVVH